MSPPFGSAMRDETKIEDWRFSLARLKESRPLPGCCTIETQLYGRLRLSYDGLDEVLQKCFLYFAALPEDTEVSTEDLCKLWISEDLFGEDIDQWEARAEARSSLKLLSMRSLLEVRCENGNDKCLEYFHMHDSLRDVATSVFRDMEKGARNCPIKPVLVLHSELWNPAVEKAMTDLRMKRMSLIFNYLKTPDLDHKRTCMLESHVMARISPKCPMGADFFLSLRKLRYLEMTEMIWLDELPESITGLNFLRFLDLSSCEALKKLPESIGNLRSLRHLHLASCKALEELPGTIGDLQSLKHLLKCRRLKELPETIRNLGSLKILNLRGCQALFMSPEIMTSIALLRSRNTFCVLDYGASFRLRMHAFLTSTRGRNLPTSAGGNWSSAVNHHKGYPELSFIYPNSSARPVVLAQPFVRDLPVELAP